MSREPSVPIDDEIEVQTRRDGQTVTGGIAEPAKVLRLGRMVRALLEELRGHESDELSRDRLAEIHRAVIAQLDETLSGYLREELEAFTLPMGDSPSQMELQLAQAQLVGWLEGLFQGIQAAAISQQHAARQQLAELRQEVGGEPKAPGQYL